MEELREIEKPLEADLLNGKVKSWRDYLNHSPVGEYFKLSRDRNIEDLYLHLHKEVKPDEINGFHDLVAKRISEVQEGMVRGAYKALPDPIKSLIRKTIHALDPDFHLPPVSQSLTERLGEIAGTVGEGIGEFTLTAGVMKLARVPEVGSALYKFLEKTRFAKFLVEHPQLSKIAKFLTGENVERYFQEATHMLATMGAVDLAHALDKDENAKTLAKRLATDIVIMTPVFGRLANVEKVWKSAPILAGAFATQTLINGGSEEDALINAAIGAGIDIAFRTLGYYRYKEFIRDQKRIVESLAEVEKKPEEIKIKPEVFEEPEERVEVKIEGEEPKIKVKRETPKEERVEDLITEKLQKGEKLSDNELDVLAKKLKKEAVEGQRGEVKEKVEKTVREYKFDPQKLSKVREGLPSVSLREIKRIATDEAITPEDRMNKIYSLLLKANVKGATVNRVSELLDNVSYKEAIERVKNEIAKEETPTRKETLQNSLKLMRKLEREVSKKRKEIINLLKNKTSVRFNANKIAKFLNEKLAGEGKISASKLVEKLASEVVPEKKIKLMDSSFLQKKADQVANKFGFLSAEDMFRFLKKAYPKKFTNLDPEEIKSELRTSLKKQKIEEEIVDSPKFRQFGPPVDKRITSEIKAVEELSAEDVRALESPLVSVLKLYHLLDIPVVKGEVESAMATAQTKGELVYLKNVNIPEATHELYHALDSRVAITPKVMSLSEKSEILAELERFFPEEKKIEEKMAKFFEAYMTVDRTPEVMPLTTTAFENVFKSVPDGDLMLDLIKQTRGRLILFKKAPTEIKQMAQITSKSAETKIVKATKDEGVKKLVSWLHNKVENFYEKELNIFHRVDKIDKYWGITSLNESLGEMAKSLTQRVQGLTKIFVKDGVIKWEAIKPDGTLNPFRKRNGLIFKAEVNPEIFYEVKPYGQIIDEVRNIKIKGLEGGSEDLFRIYRLSKEMLKMYEEFGDSMPHPEGFSKEECEEIVGKYSQYFEKPLQDLNQFFNALWKVAYDAGVISKEQLVALTTKPYYAHLFRLGSVLDADFDTAFSLFRKRMFSTRPFVDPVESDLWQINWLARRMLENDLLARLYQKSLVNPLKKTEEGIEIIPVEPIKKPEISKEEFLKMVKDAYPDATNSDLEMFELLYEKWKKELSTFFSQIRRGELKNIYSVKIKGETKWLKVDDLTADALNLIREGGRSMAFWQMFRDYTALKRSLATTFSPVWMVRNLLRDPITLYFQSSKWTVPYLPTTKGIYLAVSGRNAYQFLADLYGISYTTFSQLAGSVLERELERGTPIAKIAGFVEDVYDNTFKILSKFWKGFDKIRLENLTQISEMASRLGVLSSYDITDPVERAKAVRDARQATYFWGQRGTKRSVATWWNNYSAFFRAKLNVVEQTTSVMVKHPVRTFLRGAPFLLLSLYEFLRFKDDKEWLEMPHWRPYISYTLGKTHDKWLFIPLNEPYFGAIHGVLINLLRETTRNIPVPARDWFADVFFNVFNPFSTYSVIPDAGQWLVSIKWNKNWAGAPIVPDYLKERPAQEQYTRYTSDSAIAISKILAKYHINVSPLHIQATIENQLSYFGKLMEASVDSVISLLGIKLNELQEDWDFIREFGLTSFIHEKYNPRIAQSVDVFLKRFEKLRGVQRTISEAKDKPEREEKLLREYWKEYNNYKALSPFYNSIRKWISLYRRVEEMDIDEKEKKNKLDSIEQTIYALAEIANEAYETYLTNRKKVGKKRKIKNNGV